MNKQIEKEIVLVLDNIRSVHNVGAIFRTADACGVSKIFLCGYTPQPVDRFGRKRGDVAKAALGAEETIQWQSYESTEELLISLKEKDFYIIGIEQGIGSADYKEITLDTRERVAFVLGNEVEGLSELTMNLCNVIAEIPMVGMKESLNVSVAAGVVLFRVLNI